MDDFEFLMNQLEKFTGIEDLEPEAVDRIERICSLDDFRNAAMSDLPLNQNAYILLKSRDATLPRTEDEIATVIRRIKACEYSGEFAEAESILDIARFDANCSDERKDDLIFCDEYSVEDILAFCKKK